MLAPFEINSASGVARFEALPGGDVRITESSSGYEDVMPVHLLPKFGAKLVSMLGEMEPGGEMDRVTEALMLWLIDVRNQAAP